MTRQSTTLAAVAVVLVVCVQPTMAVATADSGGVSFTSESSIGAEQTDPSTPETQGEFLSAFQELDGADALSAYGTMEVVRARAVVAVQAGEFTTAKRERMSHLLAAMRSFVAAHQAAQEGDRRRGLALAEEASSSIESLRADGGREYATLAELSVDRFYRRQGDRLRERARGAETTPDRIELFEAAVSAYRSGGADDRLSSTATNLEQTRATFQSDLSELNASVATIDSFLSGCAGRCFAVGDALSAYGLGVFDQYLAARTAASDARRAVSLADKHGLEDRRERLAATADDAETALRSLTLAIVTVSVGYMLVIGTIGGLVIARVSQWGSDTADARVGEILPREPLEVTGE